MDLALASGAFGVHLGQQDLAAEAARRILGPETWIGASTHRRSEVTAAVGNAAVDVVAVGPVFATSSKENAEPVVGLELVRWAASRTDKPIVAIGGLDAGRASEALAAGASSAAVLGALTAGLSSGHSLEANVRALLTAVDA